MSTSKTNTIKKRTTRNSISRAPKSVIQPVKIQNKTSNRILKKVTNLQSKLKNQKRKLGALTKVKTNRTKNKKRKTSNNGNENEANDDTNDNVNTDDTVNGYETNASDANNENEHVISDGEVLKKTPKDVSKRKQSGTNAKKTSTTRTRRSRTITKKTKSNEPKRSYCNLNKTQFDMLFGAVGVCTVCGGNILDHPGRHEIFSDDYDDEDYEDDDPAGENDDGNEIESSEEERQQSDKLMQEDLNFVDGVEPLLTKKQREIYSQIKPRLKDVEPSITTANQATSHTTREVVDDQRLSQRIENDNNAHNVPAQNLGNNTLHASNVPLVTNISNGNLPTNNTNGGVSPNVSNQNKNHDNVVHDTIMGQEDHNYNNDKPKHDMHINNRDDVTDIGETIYAQRLVIEQNISQDSIDRIKRFRPQVTASQRWRIISFESAERYESTKNIYQSCFPLPIEEVRHVTEVMTLLTAMDKVRRTHPNLSSNEDLPTPLQRELVSCCPVTRGEVQRNQNNQNIFVCNVCNHGPEGHENQNPCPLTEKEAYLFAYSNESSECPICLRLTQRHRHSFSDSTMADRTMFKNNNESIETRIRGKLMRLNNLWQRLGHNDSVLMQMNESQTSMTSNHDHNPPVVHNNDEATTTEITNDKDKQLITFNPKNIITKSKMPAKKVKKGSASVLRALKSALKQSNAKRGSNPDAMLEEGGESTNDSDNVVDHDSSPLPSSEGSDNESDSRKSKKRSGRIPALTTFPIYESTDTYSDPTRWITEIIGICNIYGLNSQQKIQVIIQQLSTLTQKVQAATLFLDKYGKLKKMFNWKLQNENSVMTHFVKNFMGPGEKDRLTVALEALKNKDIGDLRDYCTKFTDLAQRAGYKDNERASIALFERHLCKEAMDRLQQAKDKRDEEGNGEYNSLKLEIEVVLRLIRFAPATYMEKLRAEMNNDKNEKAKDAKVDKVNENEANKTRHVRRNNQNKYEENKKTTNNETSKRNIYTKDGQIDPYKAYSFDQRLDHWKKTEADRQKRLDNRVTMLVTEQMKSLNPEKNLATNVNVATTTTTPNTSTNNAGNDINMNVSADNATHSRNHNVNSTSTRSNKPRPILKKVKFRKDKESSSDDDSSDDDQTLYQYVVKKKKKSKFKHLHEIEDDFDVNAVNATDFDRSRPQALAQAGQGGGRGAYNNRVKTYANNQQQQPAVNQSTNNSNASNQSPNVNDNNPRNNTPCAYCGIPGHSTNACFKKKQSEFETENKKLQTQLETLQKVVQDQSQVKNVRIVQSSNSEQDNNYSQVNSLMNRRLTAGEQRKVVDYSHLLPSSVTVVQTYNVKTAAKTNFHSIEKIMLCQIEGLEVLLSPLNDTGADISIISLDVVKKYKLKIHLPDDENVGIRVADTRILMRIGYVTIKIHILFPTDPEKPTIETIKRFEVMETAIPFIFGTDLLPIIFPRDEILNYVPKSRSTSLVPLNVKYIDAQPFNYDSFVWLDKNQEMKFRDLSTQNKCMMSMNMIHNLKITCVNMIITTTMLNDEFECESLNDDTEHPDLDLSNITDSNFKSDKSNNISSEQNTQPNMSSKTPTAENVIRCSLCHLRTFASEYDFEAHKRAVHAPGRMKCYNCNYWFDSRAALENHKLKDNCNKEQKQKKKQNLTITADTSPSPQPIMIPASTSTNKNIILSKHQETAPIELCQYCQQRHFTSFHCDQEVEAAKAQYQKVMAEKQKQDQQQQRQVREEQRHEQTIPTEQMLTPWEKYLREKDLTRGNVSLISTPMTQTASTVSMPATLSTSSIVSPPVSTSSQQTTPVMPSPMPMSFIPPILPLPLQLQSQRSETVTMDDVFDLEEWFRSKGISVLITRQNYEQMREQRRYIIGDAKPTQMGVPTHGPRRYGSRREQDRRNNNTNTNTDPIVTEENLTSSIPRQRSREARGEGSPITPKRMCRYRSGCTHDNCRFNHPEGWNPIEALRQREERSRSPPVVHSNPTITPTSESMSRSTSMSTSQSATSSASLISTESILPTQIYYRVNPVRVDGTIDEAKLKKHLVIRNGKYAWVYRQKGTDKLTKKQDRELIKRFDVPTIPLDASDIGILMGEARVAAGRNNKSGDKNDNDKDDENKDIPFQDKGSKAQRYIDKDDNEDDDSDIPPCNNHESHKYTHTATSLSTLPTKEVGGGGITQDMREEMNVNELIFSIFNINVSANNDNSDYKLLTDHNGTMYHTIRSKLYDVNNNNVDIRMNDICENEVNMDEYMFAYTNHVTNDKNNTNARYYNEMNIELNDLNESKTYNNVETTNNNNVKCMNVTNNNENKSSRAVNNGGNYEEESVRQRNLPIINEHHYIRLPSGIIPVGDFEIDEMKADTRQQFTSHFNFNFITHSYCVLCDSCTCNCIELLPPLDNDCVRNVTAINLPLKAQTCNNNDNLNLKESNNQTQRNARISLKRIATSTCILNLIRHDILEGPYLVQRKFTNYYSHLNTVTLTSGLLNVINNPQISNFGIGEMPVEEMPSRPYSFTPSDQVKDVKDPKQRIEAYIAPDIEYNKNLMNKFILHEDAVIKLHVASENEDKLFVKQYKIPQVLWKPLRECLVKWGVTTKSLRLLRDVSLIHPCSVHQNLIKTVMSKV
jgi:hypothetical protein